ncbi:hypothetical protein D3C78_1331510 [compost metagenome]
MHHDRRADPAVDGLFQRDITGVITAHEAHLNQPSAMGHLGIDDASCTFRRCCQRLFAKARLAGGDCRQHILLMRRAPGGDEHGIHIG